MRKINRFDSYLFGNTPTRATLQAPHALQRKILDAITRYTFIILICGRRFGKSYIISGTDPCLFDIAVYDGYRVGMFTPVSSDAGPVLSVMRENFSAYCSHEDNTRRFYDYNLGGAIKYFSAPNTGKKEVGRGDNFKYTIYDEFQKFMPEVSRHHVTKVAMPWMLDTPGSKMFFVGTANGIGTHMYELAIKGLKNGLKEGLIYQGDVSDLTQDVNTLPDNAEYLTIRMPSHANPFLDEKAIALLESEMTTLDAQQEIYCRFVQIGGRPWCYAAAPLEVQQRIYRDTLPIDWRAPLFLCFDFNKSPQTAVLVQCPGARVKHNMFKAGVNVVKEFTTTAGEKSSIYDLIRNIQDWIYNETGKRIGRWYKADGTPLRAYGNPFPFMVGGDATGNTGDGRQKTSKTYYEIIAHELQLSMMTQFRIETHNLTHAESHAQVNVLFEKHDKFFINRKACPLLVQDIGAAQSDPYRGIDKKQYDPHKLDALRYFVNTFKDRYRRGA